jgi:hypothetical protein
MGASLTALYSELKKQNKKLSVSAIKKHLNLFGGKN